MTSPVKRKKQFKHSRNVRRRLQYDSFSDSSAGFEFNNDNTSNIGDIFDNNENDFADDEYTAKLHTCKKKKKSSNFTKTAGPCSN